jgi:hypothetical protein
MTEYDRSTSRKAKGYKVVAEVRCSIGKLTTTALTPVSRGPITTSVQKGAISMDFRLKASLKPLPTQQLPSFVTPFTLAISDVSYSFESQSIMTGNTE